MKKSKPKIKKLPKYNLGGGSGRYNPADPYRLPEEEESNGLTTNQYIGAGTAAITGGTNMYNVSKNPNATLRDKQNASYETATGVVGAINPVAGLIMGGAKMIADPIRDWAEQSNPDGSLKNRNRAKAMSVVGSILSPSQAITAKTNGIDNPNDYVNNLEEENRARIAQEQAYNSQMYSHGGYKIPKGVYNNGGIVNAELEKQELFQTPNGDINGVNGNSHNNGGVPINIPNGTRILSDKLKINGVTFAKLGEKLKTNKEDKTLSDDKATQLAKSTANSLKEFKLKQYDKLFQSQEQLKADKVANYAKRMGMDNYIPQSNSEIQQFDIGGTKKLNFNSTPYYGQGYNPYQNSLNTFDINGTQPLTPIDNNQIEQNNRFMNTDTSNSGVYNSQVDNNSDSNNFNYSNLAGLASLAGPIYGLATNKKLPKANFQTPDYLKYDPTSELRQNAMAARFQRTMLKDNVGGNAGAYLANINQIGASSAERDAKTLRDSYNINSQGYNQNQRDVANIRNQEMDYRRKDEAGYRDKNENNINQIGMGVSQFALDNKATNQDQDTLDIISTMYPNYSYNKSKRGWYHKTTGEKLNPKKTV